MLYLLPDTTKNKKGGHCKITLTCDILCFSVWLQQATYCYAAAVQPITKSITRPLEVGTKQFAEKLMTTSNTWDRLTKGLKKLGMYTGHGQNGHNARRGNMIHQQQHIHASYSEIGMTAMCNENNAKYYTEVHRFRGNTGSVCQSSSVEDEHHCLFDCPAYTYRRGAFASLFQGVHTQ